jgi:hypothetical protein
LIVAAKNFSRVVVVASGDADPFTSVDLLPAMACRIYAPSICFSLQVISPGSIPPPVHTAEEVAGQPPSRPPSYVQYSTTDRHRRSQDDGQGQQAGTNAGEPQATAVLASSSSSSSASHRKLAYDPST